ncbi:hypothetical protein H0264_18560 [Nocardia huaxiensis]|uniref:Uncharacterized protein n=1 Tax=Nocardia huaxiensis TaxID=2755382 RepID=A0A7D6ZS36_9NOCA|nr:hypothetical protein [Nocardia huaxiensis]QLY33963.1 hypothetical protein H0264_18560 [Nocardia huaxiensis]
MRIFRDHDDDPDPDEEPQRPGKGFGPDEVAAQADLLADEIADHLADVAAAADATTAGTDQPAPAKPTLRLVPPLAAPAATDTSDTAKHPEPESVSSAAPPSWGRVWRASAAGSSVVVGIAATTAWGQPAEVGIPVTVYGLGWIAYLLWDTAHRPSPSLALAAFTERRAARAQRDTP